MPLDEKALRREGFQDGVPVVMSDGQAWHFPMPRVTCLYPRMGEDGAVTMAAGFDVGSEYDRLVDVYVETEPDDLNGQLCAIAKLAYFLLSRNYVLTFDDFATLLVWSVDDADTNRAVWNAARDVVMGRLPKAIPVGDAPV